MLTGKGVPKKREKPRGVLDRDWGGGKPGSRAAKISLVGWPGNCPQPLSNKQKGLKQKIGENGTD